MFEACCVTVGSAALLCTYKISYRVQFIHEYTIPPCRHTVCTAKYWVIWIHKLLHWLLYIHKPSYPVQHIYRSWFVKQTVSIVWIISRCVGLYKFISHISMYTVFMSHNPVLLYKAVNSIVLINKPCYCLAWIYNPQHCSFSNSFIAVCVVGAKNPYTAIFEWAQRRMRKSLPLWRFIRNYFALFG